MPNELFPRNSTFVTESPASGSEAVAMSVTFAGALNTAAFGGLVSETEGGWLAVAELTVTEPCMKGWMLQMYGKVPGLSNIWVKVAPAFSVPESHTPVVLVDVWKLPVQSHSTESLTLMVTLEGVKLKLATVTFVRAA